MEEISRFREIPEIRFHREARLLEIVDGDTLDVEIDLGWSTRLKERIRLAGVDTPEINLKTEKRAGEWVKTQVERFFGIENDQIPEDMKVILTSVKYDRTGRIRDRYCRTVAEVYRIKDGLCLNQFLLDEKLGWSADLDGNLSKERSLSSLTGLPAELRE